MLAHRHQTATAWIEDQAVGLGVHELRLRCNRLTLFYENKRLTLSNNPGGGGGVQPGRKKSYSTS